MQLSPRDWPEPRCCPSRCSPLGVALGQSDLGGGWQPRIPFNHHNNLMRHHCHPHSADEKTEADEGSTARPGSYGSERAELGVGCESRGTGIESLSPVARSWPDESAQVQEHPARRRLSPGPQLKAGCLARIHTPSPDTCGTERRQGPRAGGSTLQGQDHATVTWVPRAAALSLRSLRGPAPREPTGLAYVGGRRHPQTLALFALSATPRGSHTLGPRSQKWTQRQERGRARLKQQQVCLAHGRSERPAQGAISSWLPALSSSHCQAFVSL